MEFFSVWLPEQCHKDSKYLFSVVMDKRGVSFPGLSPDMANVAFRGQNMSPISSISASCATNVRIFNISTSTRAFHCLQEIDLHWKICGQPLYKYACSQCALCKCVVFVCFFICFQLIQPAQWSWIKWLICLDRMRWTYSVQTSHVRCIHKQWKQIVLSSEFSNCGNYSLGFPAECFDRKSFASSQPQLRLFQIVFDKHKLSGIG